MAIMKTFTIAGVASTAPVPLAVQRGDLLFTSGVMGKESDGSIPADPGRQMELAFQHMITLAEMAGGDKDSIAHISVVLSDNVHRDHVNEVTIKHWPDANNRPARHSEQGSTPPGAIVECYMIADVGANSGKRKIYEIEGVSHTAPIPLGMQMGNLLFSATIQPRETGNAPEDPEAQIALAFKNTQDLLALAGGTMDDVAHMNTFIRDADVRKALNGKIRETFPEDDDRPARHTYQVPMNGKTAFNLEYIAVLGGEKRKIYEIPGVSHNAPIPLAVKKGNLLFSSTVMGRERDTRNVPEDPQERIALALQNIKDIVALAGGKPENIARIKVGIAEGALREQVNAAWLKAFPDEATRPARSVAEAFVPDDALFECDFIAVLDN